MSQYIAIQKCSYMYCG